jgi:hypothetical protein
VRGGKSSNFREPRGTRRCREFKKEIAMSLSRFAVGCVVVALSFAAGCAEHKASSPKMMAAAPAADQAKWSVTIDNIEGCSCPAFCQCYFTGQPALHEGAKEAHAMRYCRFNNAFRITKGHFGDEKLDGLTFWMAGDLGGDFSKGEMDWAVLHFEPSATPAQRAGVETIVKALMPVSWKSFTIGADAKIDWNKDPEGAVAKLNDGKSGEIVLKQVKGQDGKPVVIENVKFWAATKNSGFHVMKNEVEAYREGPKAFEYMGSNGFFTTIQISSQDAKAAADGALPRDVLARTGDCCRKM